MEDLESLLGYTLHPVMYSILAAVSLLLISVFVFFISNRALRIFLSSATSDFSNIWAQAFLNGRFLTQASWIFPVFLVYHGVELIPNLPKGLTLFLERGSLLLLLVVCLLAVDRLLRNLGLAYSSLEIAKARPIKGFIQILLLFLYCTGLILFVSVIFNRSPLVFLSGLGAATAIFVLIFRDTLLSLVAGVQMTTNNFIRVGDWIEMPQFAADGDVIDISLHAVRVQNWDRTITVIPTHKFLEHSFKNWRGMTESGGRRIKRALYIDMTSIRFLSPEEVREFRRFPVLRSYIEEKERVLECSDEVSDFPHLANTKRLTNIGTFRAYLISYLRRHPRIHQHATFIVRQLAPTPQGLPLEVYVFTDTTVWREYEAIQSDIFDHIIAIAPDFGLRLFQSRTD